MASKPPEWGILIVVVGANKQALLAWWEQLVCIDHVVLSDKEYLKIVSESKGFVEICGSSCQ